MTPLFLDGLQAKLGDFGFTALQKAQEIGMTLRTFVSEIQPLFPDLSLRQVRQEWKDVWNQTNLEPAFKALDPAQLIPDTLYRDRTVPMAYPYSYRVHVYGRDLTTGRYRAEDAILTSYDKLSPDEAVDQMRSRIGAEGDSPAYDIFTIDVRGAFVRSPYEEEEW